MQGCGNNIMTTNLTRTGNIGGILARTSSSGSVFYGYDGGGNVVTLTNRNDAVVGSYTYDAWGNTVASSGNAASENPYRFSTKEQIGALYSYGLRFYSPGIGRWINRDPIGEDGGANLYGFVSNNPVNAVDEYGLVNTLNGPSVMDMGNGGRAYYPTADEAVKPLLKALNPVSIRDHVEYAGRVYKNPDGTYSTTYPNKGTLAGSFAGKWPTGTQNAGDYHTHGAYDPEYDNENFSPGDKEGNDDEGVPGYLATPGGTFQKYTPIPGKSGAGQVTLLKWKRRKSCK